MRTLERFRANSESQVKPLDQPLEYAVLWPGAAASREGSPVAADVYALALPSPLSMIGVHSRAVPQIKIIWGCISNFTFCTVSQLDQPDFKTSQADTSPWQGHQHIGRRISYLMSACPSLLQTRKLRTMPMLTSRLEETVSRHSSDFLGVEVYSTPSMKVSIRVKIGTSCTARKEWGAHHQHEKAVI